MGDKLVKNEYDKAGRLTSKTFGDTVLAKYEYDQLDRRIKGQYFDVKWDYTYDQQNQLTGAVNSKGDRYAYTYDPIGNRLQAVENGKPRTFTYNKLNQISNDGYAYDAWGNMTKTPEAEYTYDLKNRLTGVKKSDGTFIRYEYDPLAQRIASTVNTRNRTEFLMSGMVEYARNDGKPQYHTLGLDLLGSLTLTGAVGSILATNDTQYLYDGNGNVTASAKNSNISDKLAYEPFGKQITTVNLPFTFSSKAVNPSGMSYYGYRFYDADTARWKNIDPIAEHGGVNLYCFVKNSAIGKYDLVGMSSVACTDNGIVATEPYSSTGFRMDVPAAYVAAWGTITVGVKCQFQRIVKIRFSCPCSCKAKGATGTFSVDVAHLQVNEQNGVMNNAYRPNIWSEWTWAAPLPEQEKNCGGVGPSNDWETPNRGYSCTEW